MKSRQRASYDHTLAPTHKSGKNHDKHYARSTVRRLVCAKLATFYLSL